MEAFLVLGATGTQGGATARALLSLSPSNSIHALVRDVESPQARNLQSLSPNIRLFPGNHNDCAALSVAAAGVAGAFINVSMERTDFEAEQRHVRKILEALSSVSTMKRVMFASVAGAKDPSVAGNLKQVEFGTFRYAYYKNKVKNEALVQEAAEAHGWSWTILQPAVFLTNWLPSMVDMMFPYFREHRIDTAFPEDHKRFWVDPQDTGRFAAHALLGRSSLQNQAIPLANEHLTDGEMVARLDAVMQEKIGQQIRITINKIPLVDAQKVRQSDLRVGSELNQLDNPAYVDLVKLKSFGIELGTVTGFFEREHETLRSILSRRRAPAFYSILYHQHQGSLGFEAQLTPIRNGTANWYRIWNHMTSITPLLTTEFTHIYDLWRRTGFFRHAPEVNRLSADLILSLTNFYADIAAAGDFSSPSIITPFEVSGQHDESDSAQMNNVINFLQKFSF